MGTATNSRRIRTRLPEDLQGSRLPWRPAQVAFALQPRHEFVCARGRDPEFLAKLLDRRREPVARRELPDRHEGPLLSRGQPRNRPSAALAGTLAVSRHRLLQSPIS